MMPNNFSGGLFKYKSYQPQKDNRPDMVYFYSEPLVDYVKNAAGIQQIVTTGFEQLSIDAEYVRLIKILDDTKKDFKILK